MNSLRAQLLVAVPQLPDANFYRTVVLMIQHDDDGALGVVLNRPSEVKIADIWEDVANEPSDSQDPINLGGPVEGPLLALHTQPSLAETEILPGIYVATDRESLNQIVRQHEHPYRLFSGYSGWGGGQLEGEMDAGGWLTLPAKHEYVFHDDDDLWKTVAEDIGNEILLKALKIHEMPNDPSLN